ncbi:ROK family protein [Roseibium marinum]|uniref:Transcriptional regulator of PTS protein n=1 Tax=Roseibium marinum TaxID=281252 RepID=A0A2S3UYI5_9HYPH|nr:ROK family protein [Roseibium marinum]POF32746.1 transcriptional regulator of PTS gene [Roseibium marinum]
MTIARLVRDGRARTRSDVADQLSMRPTSVSDLVGELVDKTILHEAVIKLKGRGRPAVALHFNARRFCAVLISVIDRKLVARAVDMDYGVLLERSVEPPHDAGNAEMASCFQDLITGIAGALPAGVELGVVVLSLSGLLDVPRRMWCFSSRWPNLQNLQIADALAHLPWEIVLIRNLDAELSGIRLKERLDESENTLLLHWGYGIGAAFCSGGSVINRDRGRFCEIGHWGLGDAKGRPCTCGNTDCLETVAALWALRPALKADYPDLPLDEHGLAAEIRHLDLQDHALFRAGLTQLLRLTANLCRLLFPDRIILTGPFVQNPEIFREFVDAIGVSPLIKSVDRIRVTVGEIDRGREALGALNAPFDDLLRNFLAGNRD